LFSFVPTTLSVTVNVGPELTAAGTRAGKSPKSSVKVMCMLLPAVAAHAIVAAVVPSLAAKAVTVTFLIVVRSSKALSTVTIFFSIVYVDALGIPMYDVVVTVVVLTLATVYSLDSYGLVADFRITTSFAARWLDWLLLVVNVFAPTVTVTVTPENVWVKPLTVAPKGSATVVCPRNDRLNVPWVAVHFTICTSLFWLAVVTGLSPVRQK
jgi:hypothetical protein